MADVTQIRLEPWGPGDRGLLEQLLGDPLMTQHLGGPESAAKLDERQSRYEKPGSRQYKVIVDGRPAGYVGYWEREWNDELVWETGWAVVPAFQGRGIATLGMQALIEVIGSEAERRPVHAFPSVDNGPSNSVCRKLGFQLLGALDFEYPPGNPLLCNDWVLDLEARGSQAYSG